MSAKSAIANGSKSFFLASLFFPKDMRQDCWILYRWCRACDDRIDLAPNPALASVALARLKDETLTALEFQSGPEEFAALGDLFKRHRIPHRFALDLLRGLAKDTYGAHYQTLKDVEDYAYDVAGAVGLMMARLMGAEDPAAAAPAKNLGEAMQLTNIARDVEEDFRRGRIYLPGEWLEEAGVDSTRLTDPSQQERLFAVVSRLLGRADELYASGLSGLKYLPWRAALAVAAAALIYRAIGRKIRRRGPRALARRTVVGTGEKLLLALGSLFLILPSRPSRALMERT